MQLAESSTRSVFVLFGVLGLVAGFYFPAAMEWIFYTTKPIVDDWFIVPLAVVFGASFCGCPIAAFIVQRRSPAKNPRRLLWIFAGVWLAAVFLTSIAVRLFTAKFHYSTLSLPDWLIPTESLLVPTAGAVAVLAAFWMARRRRKTGTHQCALRGGREDFVAFLDASPDVPPMPGDEK